MSRIRLIGRNIGFSALSRLVSMIVSFCLFPFILKYVGKEVYGVYLVATTITGYFGLLDLGVMSSLTKYVSEYNGKKDPRGIANIVNASFSFYLTVGIVIALFSFVCALYFDNFFNIKPANIQIFKQLFIIAGISALVVWPLNTFRGLIQGMNLWNIDSLVNICIQIINALMTFIIFFFGYSIIQFFILTQVLIILSGIIFYCIAKRRFGLKINFPHKIPHTYKIIFNFSFFVFISSLLSIFFFQVHNIIIGYFISVSAVSIYAVAYNIQNYLRVINSTIGAPPWTLASEMEGACDYDGQRKLILKGTKFVSAAFLPVVLIVLFFAEPFIIYWMGTDFQESILPARIIVFFWLFAGISELASGMISAKGMVRKALLIYSLVAVSNLTITFSLIRVLGITAVALGLSFSGVFVGFPLILRLALRSLNISFKEYFNKTIKKNLWLYSFVAAFSLCLAKYFYPKNIYYTLLEMGFIYFASLGFYYLFILTL